MRVQWLQYKEDIYSSWSIPVKSSLEGLITVQDVRTWWYNELLIWVVYFFEGLTVSLTLTAAQGLDMGFLVGYIWISIDNMYWDSVRQEFRIYSENITMLDIRSKSSRCALIPVYASIYFKWQMKNETNYLDKIWK